LSTDAPLSTRTLLVRHAQASFGAADYDVLSARGERQARLLGAWIAAHPHWRIARVQRGDQRRHAQTLDAIYDACAAVGRELPPAEVQADWNEFDHVALFRCYAARFPEDPRPAALLREPGAPGAHHLVRAMLAAWARGDLDASMPESWAAFSTRVRRAFDALAGTPGYTLVLSSGGAIARCAQAALDLDVARTIACNLALANSAISEFRHRGEGWDLVSWNTLPHLAAAEHLPLASHF
jgi:broad specificity phosphatase PhoE